MTAERVQAEYVAFLEAENDQLREQILQLKHLLGARIEWPLHFDFSRQQGVVFGMLLKREIVTKEMAMSVLYGSADKAADPKIIDVFVCHMRRKLKRYDLSIETSWGQGYYLTPATKAAIQSILDKAMIGAAA